MFRTIFAALLPIAFCIGIANAQEKTESPTYMENFRRICSKSKPRTEKILKQPITNDFAYVAESLVSVSKKSGSPLSEKPLPEKLRIGANRVDVKDAKTWKHFESTDRRIWIDIIEFKNEEAAVAVMKQRFQPHSGTMSNEESTFTTIMCNEKRNSVNSIMRRGPFIFNAGRSLPFKVLFPGNDRLPKEMQPHRGENTLEERKEVQKSIDTLIQILDNVATATRHPKAIAWSPPENPTPEQLRQMRIAGFSRMWSEVKFNYPFFARRLELDWDSVLELYLPRVMKAETDSEYVAILRECIALLKDGHTWVLAKDGPKQDLPPIAVENIQGRPVITHIADIDSLKSTGIRPGQEIVAVDKSTVSDFLAEKVYPLICASTKQDRDNRAFARMLLGTPDSKVTLTLKDVDGTEKTVELNRDSSKHKAKLTWRSKPPFEFRKLNDETCYVAINTFADSNVIVQFEKAFKQIMSFKSLIIDVRNNSGGSSSNSYAVVGRLITENCDKTSRWKTRMYRPAHRSWGLAEEWHEGESQTIRPRGKEQFTGPVAVLIGPKTYSAAEDFLVPLKSIGRATLIGETTGGSTGNPLVFDVHAAKVAVVSKWDSFPDGTEFVGHGIKPDIKVAPTSKNISNRRDPVLEKAIEFLRNKTKK